MDSLGDGVTIGVASCFESRGGHDRRDWSTDAPPETWADHYGVFQTDENTPFPTDRYPLVRALQAATAGPLSHNPVTLRRGAPRTAGVSGAKAGMPYAPKAPMAKVRKIIAPKKLRKAVRRNPYAFGITAALVAVGGVAAALSRGGGARQLKDRVTKRLANGLSNEENSIAATANEPY